MIRKTDCPHTSNSLPYIQERVKIKWFVVEIVHLFMSEHIIYTYNDTQYLSLQIWYLQPHIKIKVSVPSIPTFKCLKFNTLLIQPFNKYWKSTSCKLSNYWVCDNEYHPILPPYVHWRTQIIKQTLLSNMVVYALSWEIWKCHVAVFSVSAKTLTHFCKI